MYFAEVVLGHNIGAAIKMRSVHALVRPVALTFSLVESRLFIYVCFYCPCLWCQIYKILSATKVGKVGTYISFYALYR